MRFYEKLISLRKQKGISQEELADILDVSRQSIYKWETGLNMPDMSKIEKITEYFNVSYNYLLDEKIDAFENKEPVKKLSNVKLKFRNVFVSKINLDYWQADFEHGYLEGQTREVCDSEDLFTARKESVMCDLKKRGYTNVVFPQPDCCLCYFEDEKNKSFGIFFNGSEQFVCPYENFIDVNILSDGYSLNYNKKATFVGVGVDSLTVGQIPMAELGKPKHFTLSIVYFDKFGHTCEYKIELIVYRYYLWDILKKKKLVQSWWEEYSLVTEKGLSSISARLKGVKAKVEMIKSQGIQVEELNIETYKKLLASSIKRNREEKKIISQINQSEKKKYNIIKPILFWSVVGIALIVGLVFLL